MQVSGSPSPVARTKRIYPAVSSRLRDRVVYNFSRIAWRTVIPFALSIRSRTDAWPGILVVGEMNASSSWPWRRRAAALWVRLPARPALRLCSTSPARPALRLCSTSPAPLCLALVLDVACSPALTPRRSMFAIVSFEGVLNFTAEGRLYCRIGAHLHRYTLLTLTAPCHVRYLRRLETVSAATPWTTSTIRRCRCSST
jgi:hypothetical protein